MLPGGREGGAHDTGGGEGEKWCAGRQVGTAPSETQATMALQNASVLSPKSYDPDLLGRFHVVLYILQFPLLQLTCEVGRMLH